MINLDEFENELSQILEIIKHVFGLEAAVFDSQAKLVVCSPDYAKHKGRAVHAPSIQEVIYKDNVITYEPGHLPSCQGCRFKNNCPSSIEILKSLHFGTTSAGVISFTSFTKEGHDRIINNIGFYKTLLEDFAKLINILLSRKYNLNNNEVQKVTLNATCKLMEDGFICADNEGNISLINSTALELFNTDGFCTTNLFQLFPANVTGMLLKGAILSNYRILVNDYMLSIFSSPIKDNDVLIGTLIRIPKKKQYTRETASSLKHNTPPFLLDSLKGESLYIQNLKQQIKRIANSSSTVFISGETGTGKGLLAKAIHYESNRRHKPFLSINCTSIPDALFESEFFGYESGAFTGARKEGKPGKFELADEGTLFLDEISEMSLAMQSKLLGVLQEGCFERVGGINSINVDVRVITASNADLEKLIADKHFRADLFYRLNVIPIRLLPLRERREDIPILAKHFLQSFNRKLNRQILGFENLVMECFMYHNWPGNIRQLENIIEYCVNIAAQDIITMHDLPLDFLANTQEKVLQATGGGLKSMEYDLILKTINKYGWDVKSKELAARELGISLRTLYRKLEESSRQKTGSC